MNIFSNIDVFQLGLVVVIPGITSILTYNLLNPREVDWGRIALEALFYGFFVFVLARGLLRFNSFFGELTYFFVLPATIAYCCFRIRKLSFLHKFINEPSSSPWDHFFSRRKPCFIIVTMKNGDRICGCFDAESSAGCYPNNDQIYLQWAYELDEDDDISFCKPGTMGVLIAKGEYSHMEFFSQKGEDYG